MAVNVESCLCTGASAQCVDAHPAPIPFTHHKHVFLHWSIENSNILICFSNKLKNTINELNKQTKNNTLNTSIKTLNAYVHQFTTESGLELLRVCQYMKWCMHDSSHEQFFMSVQDTLDHS